jgi:hypothetical protein
MPVTAHAGHWISSVAFLAPTLFFMAWLAVNTARERRRLKGQQRRDER